MLEPLPLAAGAVAVLVYLKGFGRLRRRRPDRARLGSAAAFLAGVAVALVAVAPPVSELASELLTAHMGEHLLLGDVAALLLVLGLRRPIVYFVTPLPIFRALRRARLRRTLERAFRPRIALAVWVAALYAWHVPPLYDAAESSAGLHLLEHASFLVAGLLVWAVILDPGRSAGRRAAFAAAVLVAGMPLAELLVATPPLYPHYDAIADRPLGLTAGEDQTRAGLLMMSEQIATLGTAALLLLWSHAERIQHVPAQPPSSRGEAAGYPQRING
jgi:cytochrome c oxidase assembly factor CtaG